MPNACLMTSGAEAARKGAAGEGGGPLDSAEGRIVLTHLIHEGSFLRLASVA